MAASKTSYLGKQLLKPKTASESLQAGINPNTGLPLVGKQAEILAKQVPASKETTASPSSPTPTQAPPKVPASAVPVSTYEDIGKANIQAEYDKKGDYAEELGITSPYQSLNDEIKAIIQNQRENKAFQESQLNAQVEKNEYTVRENVKALKSAADVGISQLTPNKEGFASNSNIAAISAFKEAVNTKAQRLEKEKKDQLDAIDMAKKNLEFAQDRGDTDAIEMYRAQIAAATQQAKLIDNQIIQDTAAAATQSLAFLQNLKDTGALTGVDDTVLQGYSDEFGISMNVLRAVSNSATRALGTEKEQQKFDNQVTALGTFQGLVSSGIEIPDNILESFAVQTGLPSGELYKFNRLATSIINDKSLSVEEKNIAIQKAKEELSQMQKGIYTTHAQNVEFLKQMYRDGTSPEVIAAFKKAAFGSFDPYDPYEQAQADLLIAQADIERKHANGEVVTPQDLAAYASAKATAIEYGFDDGAYLTGSKPRNEKYEVTLSDSGDGIEVTGAVVGAKGGQCGAFVNDVMNTRVDDTVASKLKLTDESILVPTAGDIFVQKFPESADPNQYGHIGLVKKVDYENQRFLALHSNYRGNEKISEDWIPFTAAKYGHPPNPIPVKTGGGEAIKTIEDYMSDPRLEGLNYKEKKAAAIDMMNADIQAEKDTAAALMKEEEERRKKEEEENKNKFIPVPDTKTIMKGVDKSLDDFTQYNLSYTGRRYIGANDIATYDANARNVIQKNANSLGVPFLDEAETTMVKTVKSALTAIDQYEEDLNNPKIKDLLPKGWADRAIKMKPLELLAEIQANPDLAAAYGNFPAVMDVLQGIAGTNKGIRINKGTIDMILQTLPSPNDTEEFRQKKFEQLRQNILNDENAIFEGYERVKRERDAKKAAQSLSRFILNKFNKEPAASNPFSNIDTTPPDNIVNDM
nr:MAG: peptidoglycan [Podoviridae sp. ctka020]